MLITRVLRPAQRILTATVVAGVSVTCLVSVGGSTASAMKEGPHASPHSTVQAMKEGPHSTPRSVVSAMKEGRGKQSAPLVTVAQSAYPAMGTKTYERRVLRNVNRVRHQHHLRSVSFARCTNRVANHWSAHLAATNTFYHQSMTRLLHTCDAHYAGETLAMGSVTPRKIVSMWMHSAPHRHILMSKQPRRIGIGATPNSAGQWVVAANWMRF